MKECRGEVQAQAENKAIHFTSPVARKAKKEVKQEGSLCFGVREDQLAGQKTHLRFLAFCSGRIAPPNMVNKARFEREAPSLAVCPDLAQARPPLSLQGKEPSHGGLGRCPSPASGRGRRRPWPWRRTKGRLFQAGLPTREIKIWLGTKTDGGTKDKAASRRLRLWPPQGSSPHGRSCLAELVCRAEKATRAAGARATCCKVLSIGFSWFSQPSPCLI